MASASAGKEPRKAAWLIVAALSIVALACFIVLPGLVRTTITSPTNECINNLRQIDAAKQEWAFEHKKSQTDLITWDDVLPYLGRDTRAVIPKCRAGGRYALGLLVSNAPTCSISNHVLPDLPADDPSQTQPP